jgi:integrase
VKPWSDAQVGAVTDAHPGHLRLLPVLMTSCGLRIGEATAVALEDFDFDEKILHLRRQLKKLGDRHIYALPKNDLERDVPLPTRPPPPSGSTSLATRRGHARCRGRSSLGSRRRTTCNRKEGPHQLRITTPA